tara:strand:+ start:236 stop:607 length:372 start_codon:yes stop_codon:yes gene_type:complete
MPNSDNTYGTYNKQTKILTQTPALGDPIETFSNTTEAKNHFYTSDAQTVFDECCTELQWAVQNDGNGDATQLKYTMTFGTKGGNISAADDWAGQYITRLDALKDGNNLIANPHSTADSDSHLF